MLCLHFGFSMGQHCMNAFIIAASHRDYETSQAWAVLAAARFQVETGPESDITSQSKALSRNPTLATVWATRGAMRLPKPVDIGF
jgi:hypothetical protein